MTEHLHLKMKHISQATSDTIHQPVESKESPHIITQFGGAKMANLVISK